MKSIHFGASRGCGLAAVLLLLKQGNECYLLLRNEKAITDNPQVQALSTKERGNLHMIKGDALVTEDIKKVFDVAGPNVDMVITSLGGKPDFSNPLKPNISPAAICSRSNAVFLPVLKEYCDSNPTPRLIAVTSNGLDKATHDALPFLIKMMYNWILPVPHDDKIEMENIILTLMGRNANTFIAPSSEKDLKAYQLGVEERAKAIASPGWLKDAIIVRPALLYDGNSKGKYRTGEVLPKASTISRADVGHFIVNECVPGNDKWTGKAVTVAY